MGNSQEMGDHPKGSGPEKDGHGKQDSGTGSLTSKRQDMPEEVISTPIVEEACLMRPQAEQAAGERHGFSAAVPK